MKQFLFVTAISTLCLTTGCGSSSSPSPPPPPVLNLTPAVSAISPNSSEQNGPVFTLSIVGSNFIASSQAQWNGNAVATTFVNSTFVTAKIPASAVAAAGPDSVTVLNPPPGGGNSNVLSFTVPCPIPAPAPAGTQNKARLGAYYFDGWSGPLTSGHFQGLPFGPYQDRQPLSGWQDNSTCTVEQQLATAHDFGIDFFVFDWYFNVQVTDPNGNLNSALQITHALADRHGMQYAILYVSDPAFFVGPTNWTSAVTEWVGYMADPDYVLINGEPALFVLNVGEVRKEFGTSAAVSAALQQLRAAAQAQGLPGVYIVGGFGTPSGTLGQESLDDGFLGAQQDGYDAVAFYGYPFAPTPVNGTMPFSSLAAAGQWTWNEALLHSALPFIPTAMAGWDPRPWNETEPTTQDLMWYSRTPQDVSTFVQDAVTWTASNPRLRPEPSPTAPLVLIEAWNEFGEGSHVLPTVGDGTTYGDAIAAMLLAP